MPSGRVDKPITDQEVQFAHLLLAGELTDVQAAKKVGISPAMADYVKAKPRVKKYMVEYRAAVKTALVEREADALAEFNISREQILGKYWALASLPPSSANGHVIVKALDSIREMLGYGPEDGRGEEKEQGQGQVPVDPIYRSAWMKQ